MKTEKPFFGIIGKTGICTLEYYPVKNDLGTITGRKEGYSPDIFTGCPDNMPILDCSSAQDGDIVRFILYNENPAILTQFVDKPHKLEKALCEYIDNSIIAGYTVKQVKDLNL